MSDYSLVNIPCPNPNGVVVFQTGKVSDHARVACSKKDLLKELRFPFLKCQGGIHSPG
jgi:hypothetical protein